MNKFFASIYFLLFYIFTVVTTAQAEQSTRLPLTEYDPKSSQIAIALKPSDYQSIGNRIYQNECASNINNLAFWSRHEAFPSLGIAHFIWFPRASNFPFVQTFPEFLNFLQLHSPKQYQALIAILGIQSHAFAPWASREAFYGNNHSEMRIKLQNWFHQSKTIQAEFIVDRFLKQIDQIRATKQLSNSSWHHLQKIIHSSSGLFALIDYSNFKGFGTHPKESYQGQGWGVLQVIQAMPDDCIDPLKCFKHAAKNVLKQRVANAPENLSEQRWLKGWFHRIDGY